jgi:hypothetical protein
MIMTLNRLQPSQDTLKSLLVSAVDWLKTRWTLWHEAHSTKRRELYEYKKTSRLNHDFDQEIELAEDEMPDMEMIEVFNFTIK